MNLDLTGLLWPAAHFDDAVAALSRESFGQKLELETIATELSYPDFERRLLTLGPALLHFPGDDGFLAILPNSNVLSPDQKKISVDPAAIRSALCSEIEAPALKQIQETLERAEVPPSKQARAR